MRMERLQSQLLQQPTSHLNDRIQVAKVNLRFDVLLRATAALSPPFTLRPRGVFNVRSPISLLLRDQKSEAKQTGKMLVHMRNASGFEGCMGKR